MREEFTEKETHILTCVRMKVPMTGDPSLDKVIWTGRRQELIGDFLKAILSANAPLANVSDGEKKMQVKDIAAARAADYADAVMALDYGKKR